MTKSLSYQLIFYIRVYRTGVALKKVDPEAATNRNGDEAAAMALTGIAGMLQKALHERSTAICLSSSEDEVEDDEDEWDD